MLIIYLWLQVGSRGRYGSNCPSELDQGPIDYTHVEFESGGTGTGPAWTKMNSIGLHP